jgi:hypothetical protein
MVSAKDKIYQQVLHQMYKKLGAEVSHKADYSIHSNVWHVVPDSILDQLANQINVQIRTQLMNKFG